MRQPTNLLSSPPHPIPLSPMSFISCVLSSLSRLKTFTLRPVTFFSHICFSLHFIFKYIQCSPLVPSPEFPSYLLVNTFHSFIAPVGFMGTILPEKYSMSKVNYNHFSGDNMKPESILFLSCESLQLYKKSSFNELNVLLISENKAFWDKH